MPARSLRSSVLAWPRRDAVLAAARRWAAAAAAARPEVLRILAVGSYARGDAGPGSDLDLVVVVRGDPGPPHRRALAFDATGLPVPADVLVLSEAELRRHEASSTRLARMLREEAVALWPQG